MPPTSARRSYRLGVPPEPFVEPERHEDERAHGDEPREHLPERLVPKGRYIAVESQQERDPVRGDHQRKLNGDSERSLQTPAKEPQCRNVLSHGPSLRLRRPAARIAPPPPR